MYSIVLRLLLCNHILVRIQPILHSEQKILVAGATLAGHEDMTHYQPVLDASVYLHVENHLKLLQIFD